VKKKVKLRYSMRGVLNVEHVLSKLIGNIHEEKRE